MRNRFVALVVLFGCGFASTAVAQLGSYLGPQILTRGPGDIGTRAGEQVDLRLFFSANGIYDTGIQPVNLDPSGHLKTLNGLFGTEATVGVYGTHEYKHGLLSVDYTGSFRHYQDAAYYDGSDHSFQLGYTYQKSQRLTFDFREVAGTSSIGYGLAANAPSSPDSVVDPTSMLFDNRTTYVQSSVGVTYALGARTSFSVGGNGNLIRRQSSALAGLNGYGGNASIQHRLSRRTTIGFNYDRTRYGYTTTYGTSDINTYAVSLTEELSRNWKITASAGVFDTTVLGQQSVLLDPAVAAVLGVSSITVPLHQRTIVPDWNVDTGRGFMGSKNISIFFGYHRGVSSGNGIYLASKTETASAGVSYTGVRKASFSTTINYSKLQSLSQDIQPYYQVGGGTSFSYAMTHALQLSAHFDQRLYGISNSSFNRNGYRAAIGISFSPSDVPLSFR